MTIRLAYLCGEYPRATDTFIQREVAMLRKQGVQIRTISVRRPSLREQGTEELVSEREATHYLLPYNFFRLSVVHLKLLLLTPSRYLKSFLTAVSIRSPGIKSLIYQLFYFAEAGLVAEYIKKHSLIHIHNHAPDASGYVTLLASKMTGTTYSLTLHGFGILSEPNRWRLSEKIEHSLFTICVSNHARSQAMLWTNPATWKRLHVVHCGIGTQSIEPRSYREHVESILFVGRMDHVKGLPILLDSFSVLAGRYKKIKLNLVGDGPRRAEYENLAASKGLHTQVVFHGYKAQHELDRFYEDADIFVITSLFEGIPVVLIEAMAKGVPVVAPGITGIPELVEDNVTGLLTVPGNSRSLTEELERLIKSRELREKFALSARKKVEDEFNLEAEIKSLAAIFNSYIPRV